MPKWAAELRESNTNLHGFVSSWCKDIGKIAESAGRQHAISIALQKQINDLRDRLGTSTPLIIWNIAVLIAIAGLGVAVARLYGVAPY